jgi:hypothetical protein
MIDIKELRIGNWVKHGEQNVKVNDLPYLVDDNKDGYLINEIWADEYEPIPLTPEILEKCGFELIKKPKYKLGHKYKIKYSKKNGSLFQVNMGGKFLIIANIRFLHQLQNLYFALTGEELNVQL